MSQRPLRDPSQSERLLKNLSQTEIEVLLAAIDNASPDEYSSLFRRAEEASRRMRRSPSGFCVRWTLSYDLRSLAKALQRKATNVERGLSDTGDDRYIDDDIAVVKEYINDDLKPSDREMVLEQLEAITAAQESLKNFKVVAQQEAIDEVISHIKGLALYLEELCSEEDQASAGREEAETKA